MWKISVKGMWAHKRRLVRTCSAVLLGVAFLAGTLVLGDTMRAGFAQAFSDAYAGSDVVVQGSESMGTENGEQRRVVPESVLADVEALPGIALVQGAIDGLAQVTGTDGDAVGGSGPPTLGGNWADNATNPYDLVEGRAPTATGEVVIDRGTAATGELSVGDVTTVRTPTPLEATVVGIAAFGAQDSIGGSGYTGFTMEDARHYLLGDAEGYTSLSLVAAEGVTPEQLSTEVQALLPEGFSARTGEEMAAQTTEAIGDDFLNMFETFLLVFTGVALLVASFSIYNTFSVILAQRSRESALFRAIGATRRQVLGSITIEAIAVGLVASLGGLLVGFGLAVGLSTAMRSMGIDLPGGIEVTANSVIVSLVVGLVVTLLASLAPAIRASRVAPLAALRDAAIDRSDSSRGRAAFGSLLTAAGAAMVLVAALNTPEDALAFVGYGSVLCVIGVVALGPVVARPAARLLGLPIATVRGTSGQLARGNAMRNPRRTAGTASALMVGVAVVALFTVVGASLTTIVRDTVAGSITADLIVIDSGFSGSGLSPDLARELDELPEVETAVGIGYGYALIDGEEEELTVADTARLDTVIDSEVQQGSMAELTDDQIAVAQGAAEDHGWSLGSPVDLTFVDGATRTLTIGAIYAQDDLNGYFVLPRATWRAHNTLELDFVAGVTTAPGVGIEEARVAVDEVAERFGAPDAQTRDEYADDMAGEITGMLNVVYVLLALSIVIALMGIANTLALSIHERTRELGLLRAIGQTRGQLRSMVRWESVIIAVFGTVGGIGLGLFLAWGLVRSLAATDEQLAVFSAPVGRLVVITLVGAVAGVIAALRPARRAGRLDVLDAIATE
ncbi:MAG: ABC transporter permease [Microthrixaceae bacterium]